MTEFAPFSLDVANQCLWRQAATGSRERVPLAPKAFDLLSYLVHRPGRLVTHRELLKALWPHARVDAQTVKQYVFEVRRALGDPPNEPRFIETLARRGYRFIPTVSDDLRLSKADAPSGHRVGPLVGRVSALEELRECLHRSLLGQRQIVFITGEPGIGKTALADEFQQQATAGLHGLRSGRGQCVEGHGETEPYYPMLEALGQLSQGASGNAFVQILAAPAPTWLVQFPALIRREHREILRNEIDGSTRARMLREICEALEAITAEIPLLLIFEDLQWADPATVDLISAVARRRAPAKLLLIVTHRTDGVEYKDPDPLRSVKRELLLHRLCREIALAPLAETEIAAYLATQSATGDPPRGLATIVHRHSEGNPLFMVAALEHMTKRGWIARALGNWQLQVPLEAIDLEVPHNLGQMIEARISRLSQEEQRVLEAASIAGTTFTPRVNAAGTDLESDAFEEICEVLSRRHEIVRPLGTERFPDATFSTRYQFVHAMYREVLYLRQAPGHRATLHRRIAERLEGLFADHLNEMAPELARHLEAGLDYARAADYQRLAAAAASGRDAHLEAAARLQRALDLVAKLPQKGSASRTDSRNEEAPGPPSEALSVASISIS